MRRIIILFFLLFSFFSFSQLPLLIREDFNDNSNEWYIKNDEIVSAQVKNGFYYLKLKNDEYTYRFWNKLFDLTQLQEYRIVCRLKHISGAGENFYGILFDAQDADNCSEFKFSSDKEYYIDIRRDEDYNYLTYRWTLPFINTRNQYNLIEIHKHNGYYDFYINRHFVKRLNARRMAPAGGKVGFYLGGKMEVVVDYIEIYGIRAKMNIVENPLNTKKVNLGKVVNTAVDELKPVISSDGQYLYFIRNGGANSQYPDNDDIWVSKMENGHWTEAQRLDYPFNDDHNNSITYISPDRTVFIVSGNYDNGVFINDEGLSVIYRKSDGSWSKPNALIISDFYNDSKYYSYCLSPDRKYLLMSVEMGDNTYGGRDIYVSFLQDDGTYSTPINLGPVINTIGNEGTPYLAADNRTLYFSSDGHPGYGDADVFVSQRLDDTWLHWSEPQNLGPNVNTSDWNAYFTIDSHGDYAYFVSYNDVDGYGNGDIYSISLSEASRPNPIAVVRGKVLDKNTKVPLQSQIVYYQGDDGGIVNTALSDSITGSFKVLFPLGKKYTIYANKAGYLSSLVEIDLTDSLNYVEIPLTLYLEKISQGQSFTLKNIYFPAGSAKFLPQSYPELKRLAEFMKVNPQVIIEISGHTNNIGSRDKLIELSLERSNAVKRFLISNGIEQNRIIVKGYGPDKPIADNSSVQGRKLNQRVEVKIIKY